jgi:hypothetical protein
MPLSHVRYWASMLEVLFECLRQSSLDQICFRCVGFVKMGLCILVSGDRVREMFQQTYAKQMNRTYPRACRTSFMHARLEFKQNNKTLRPTLLLRHRLSWLVWHGVIRLPGTTKVETDKTSLIHHSVRVKRVPFGKHPLLGHLGYISRCSFHVSM